MPKTTMHEYDLLQFREGEVGTTWKMRRVVDAFKSSASQQFSDG